MSMTYDQAIAALNDPQFQTLDGLKTLVNEVSVKVPGSSADAVTLLYSGAIGDIPAWQIAEKIGVDSAGKVITIGETPVAELLNSNEFRSALESAVGTNEITVIKALMDGVINPDGTRTEGMWDIASRNLAEAATGDIRTITPLAEPGKVFATIELPALLQNPNVTSINGVPKEYFQAIYESTGSIVEVNKAVSASSYSQMADMGLNTSIAMNPDGTPQLNSDGTQKIKVNGVDSTSFFEGTGYDGTSLPSSEINTSVETRINDTITTADATTLGEGFKNLGIGEGIVALTKGASALLGIGGLVLTGIQIYQIGQEAKAAYDQGDNFKAAQIIANGAAEIGTGWTAGIAAGELAASFLAPLLVAGPVGDVAYIVLVTAASFVGAYWGTEAVKSLLGNSTDTAPIVTIANGFETTKYSNGVIYSVALDKTTPGLSYDQQWILPNDGGGYLQIQQNSTTGADTRNVWAGIPGNSDLISSTKTTYELASPESGVIIKTVETITPDKSDGSVTDVTQRVNTDDGTVLNTTTIVQQADKSQIVSTDDGHGNITATSFDSDHNKVADSWQKADGTVGYDTFNPADGSSSGTTIKPDGSSTNYSNDGQGNTYAQAVDSNGNITATAWQNAEDGTHGGLTFNPDGSFTNSIYYKDGSGSVTIYKTDDSNINYLVNSDGSVSQQTITNSDGTGSITTYDIGNTVSSITKYNADGSSQYTTYNLQGIPVTSDKFLPDGTTINTTFDESGNPTASFSQYPDGSNRYQIYYPDGKVSSDTVVDPVGAKVIKILNPDGTINSVTTVKYDGSITTVTKNSDGSTTQYYTDPNGSNTTSTTYPDGSLKSLVQTNADGSSSSLLKYPDGSLQQQSINNADGSSQTVGYYNDQAHTQELTQTVNADGSKNATHYNPDGTVDWSFNFRADGSGWQNTTILWIEPGDEGEVEDIYSYDYDGEVPYKYRTDFFDSNGNLVESMEGDAPYQGSGGGGGSGTPHNQLPGTNTTLSDGTKINTKTWGNGKTSQIVTVLPNGSILTQNFYATGMIASSSLTGTPDGSTSFYTYQVNGSYVGTTHFVDGSSIRYTRDVQGNLTTTNFDAHGNKLSDSWTKVFNDTFGSDTFNADGSSTGTATNANGSYSVYVNDGHGNITTNYFDNNAVKYSDNWRKADGTSGTDYFNADGSSRGTVYSANGGVYNFANDGHDNITYQYHFNAAHSIEIPSATNTNNSLMLEPGVHVADITVSAAIGSDGAPALLINTGSGNSLTIDNGLNGAIKEFDFSDGTKLSLDQLMSHAASIAVTVPGAKGNLIFSANSGDTLVGGAGNDTLYGWNGHDTFVVNNSTDIVEAHGAGNTVQSSVSYSLADKATGAQNITLTGTADLAAVGNNLGNVITANSGNDTLIGGSGNDTFKGGTGLDTFGMSLGMGADTVIDTSMQGGVVQLNNGLPLSDLVAIQKGNDLQLQILGSKSDALLIQNYFTNPQTSWTIKDSSGNTVTPQNLLDASAAIPFSTSMAQLESDFMAQAKADLAQQFIGQGYAVQPDGSWLSNTTYNISVVTGLWGVWDKLNVQHTITYLDGTSSSYSDQETWAPYNSGNGTGIYNTSVSVNEAPVVSNASIINDTPTQTSYTYEVKWVQGLDWQQYYWDSGSKSQVVPVTDAQGRVIGLDQQLITPTNRLWEAYTTTNNNPAALLSSPPPAWTTTGDRPTAAAITFFHQHDTDMIHQVYVGDGNHTVNGNQWTVVNAGSGNDVINNAGFVYTGSGNDTVIGAGIVYTGSGNNEIDIAETVYAGSGNNLIKNAGVAYGGTGNDTFIGGSSNSYWDYENGNKVYYTEFGNNTVVAGSGNDQIFVGGGNATIEIDATKVGTDLIGGAGADARPFLAKYYQSNGGIYDWQVRYQHGGTNMYRIQSEGGSGDFTTLQDAVSGLKSWGWNDASIQDAIDSGYLGIKTVEPLPLLVIDNGSNIQPSPYYATSDIPAINLWANDFEALQSYYDQGLIPSHTVTFDSGITSDDLQFSWGQTVGAISGATTDTQSLYTTLNISWGANNQSLQVMIPHANDPLGSGVSQFTFSDGTTLSMADLIAMAPPAPTFDPELAIFQPGMGSQVLNAGSAGIQFANGISPSDVKVSRDGIDLLLSYGNGADVVRVANWYADPNNMPTFFASFEQGSKWNATSLTDWGLVQDGSAGNQTLTGLAGFSNTYIVGANDTLTGGSGFDTYVFSLGDGVSQLTNAGISTIRFGANITAADVRILQQDNDLVIQYGSQDDSIVVKNFAPNGFENLPKPQSYGHVHMMLDLGGLFQFSDGSNGSYSTDGQGNFTLNAYDSNGNLVGDFWQWVDGSYGNDSYFDDGSSRSTNHSVDGSYTIEINDGQGTSNTQSYDVSGNLIGDKITSFDSNGSKLGDTWTRTDGTYGSDTFNSDGSSNGISYQQDGSYSTYANDGHGTVVTQNYDDSGNALGSMTTQFDANGKKVSDLWTKTDGSEGEDFFYSDGSSYGISYKPDGSYSTYDNDGQGNTSTANYDAQHTITSDTWKNADGSFGADSYNADGSFTATENDGHGTLVVQDCDANGNALNTTTTILDANGNKLSDSWIYGDGTYGSDTFNSDGSSSGTSHNADGSYSNYTKDGHGNDFATNYDVNGNETSDTWTQSDGSYGNDSFFPDGSINKKTYFSNGSSVVYNNDGQGNITTANYDPQGHITGDSWQNSDGSSGSYVIHADGSISGTDHNSDGTYDSYINDGHGNYIEWDYAANGINTGDHWEHSDGSYGDDTYNPDGTSTGTSHYLDGSYRTYTNDGQGDIADYWQNADGTYGDDTFNPDGTSSGDTHKPDGTYSTYTNDGHGNVTTLNFDVNGVKVGAEWSKLDGAHGIDTYNPDGSITGIGYNVDGSYSTYTNDGQGNVIAWNFDANDVTLGGTWSKSDGTHGSETYNADGSMAATTYNADGSYSTYANDGQGDTTSLNYDSNGHKVEGAWQHADGTHGIDVYNVDGTSYGTSYNVDGSFSSHTDDGQGDTSTTNYDAQSHVTSDAWKNFDGSYGGDVYNADGTASGTTHNADGSYKTYTSDGHGNYSELDYASDSTQIGDAWQHADGTHGTDVLNVDGTSSGTSYNADGSYSAYTNDGYGHITTLNFDASGHQINNTLIASFNDTLVGSGGNDTFVVNTGTGAVHIIDTGSNNTLQFGSGIDPSQITLGLGSLMLRLDGQGDVVHIEGFDPSNANGSGAIQNFSFADGTVLTYTQLLSRGFDIYGSSGNETLTGTNLDNRIHAGSGDDVLIGSGANDTLYGGVGHDTLIGGSGNDVLIAGTGDTTLVAGSGIATMTGGSGNDTFVINNASDVINAQVGGVNTIQTSVSFTASANVQNLTGTGTADLTLIGNNLSNVITANSGNDTLIAGSGIATLNGGTGNDTFVVNNAADVINAQVGGVNTIQTSVSYVAPANVQTLTGTGTADIALSGGAQTTAINANSGNDTLVAGSGIATLNGGIGNDTFIINNVGDVVNAQAGGTNTIQTSVSYTASANVQNLTGTGTSDLTLIGNNLANVITTQSGNDTLIAGSGIATLTGGSGNDTYVINNASDVVIENAGAGTDTIQTSVSYVASANVENLIGTGTGDLTLTGNNLNNVITANSGNDTLIAGTGVATLIGGAGNNTFIINNVADVVTAQAGGINTIFTSVNYTAPANVQNMTAIGSANLTLTGNALDNVLTANSGKDTLNGGIGNDTLVSGSGIDKLVGGVGDDTYIVNNSADIITEAANEGTDTVLSSVSYVLPSNVENLTLTGNADLTATGNTLNNILTGNAGNDTLIGSSGNDTLIAGTGLVTLTGGVGNDTYIVNNAADVVTELASQGTDTILSSVSYTLSANVENLTGSGNADITLTGNTLANVITANSGNDTLIAGAGNTTLISGTGIDSMVGGVGNNVYLVNNSSDIIVEQASAGTDTVQTSVSYTLSANIENLTGIGNADMTLTGNDLNNVITGNAGNDTLIAGNGNATLTAGSGLATLIGGSGNNTFKVNNVSDVIIELANGGTDTVQTSVSYSLSANVENLTGVGNADLTLTGNDLNNVITGNAGNDTLIAGNGNTILAAGAGLATMIGGLGNNTYKVNNVGDVVIEQANAGTDTIQSTVSYTLSANVENLTGIGTADLTLIGNSLNNTLTGNAGNDTLIAGSGNTTFVAGTGLVTMIGGMGNNTYKVNNAGDVIIAQAGALSNTVQSSANYVLPANVQSITLTGSANLTATGNDLNNVITGNAGNDTLISGNGNSTLVAGTGIDTMIGGSGNNLYKINNTADVIVEQANGGIDTIQSTVSYVMPANVENLTLTGTASLTATGNDLNNIITGNSGNDTLIAGSGNATLIAGSGISTLIGGVGNDTFVINNISDVITAQAGGINTIQTSVSYVASDNVQNLTATGTAALTLTGNNLANVITANSGNDTLVAGTGLATLIGGAGSDTFVINNIGDVIIKAATTGTNTVKTSVNYVLPTNVQNITGTGTADLTLIGNSLANVITANSGNDTLIAGSGVATLTGGTGNDTFVVNNTADVVKAQAGTNLNTIQTSVSYTASANVQDLIGTGSANLTLTGNTGNDLIVANSGSDTLVGGTGTNVLQGSAGAGTLKELGGKGALLGGSGNESITGGTGVTYIDGGAGNDAITLGSAISVVGFNAGGGNDTITGGTGVSNVLSLGGGIDMNNLTFSKVGNNLVLNTGGTDSITLQNWYGSAPKHDFVTLQVIEQASVSYNAASSNALINQKIEEFSFTQLVTAFNNALTANPSLTSWNLMNNMLSAHLSGSDTAALGGDLAYYDGVNGNVTGMNMATAVSTLQNASFGKTVQTIDPWAGVSGSNNAVH